MRSPVTLSAALSAAFAAALMAALSIGSATSAMAAEAGAAFFKGKTITYIVATGPGGGNDFYGRLNARHMQKFLAGSKIIVRNMPGAGHIIGTNFIHHAKRKKIKVGMTCTFNYPKPGAESARVDCKG